jgi:hypothetical protein
MNNVTRSIIFIVTIAALGIGVAACKPKSERTNVLTATIGAREIRATVPGDAFIQPEKELAIIHSSIGIITIQQDKVLLEGVELVPLPPTAKKVEVFGTGGQLRIVADGTSVITKQISQ